VVVVERGRTTGGSRHVRAHFGEEDNEAKPLSSKGYD
jgi:hypothetical protein